ncbi:MAG: xanthine dehydrogenase molybdenum-binding subunit XdhA [Firmicutes bacterium]|nr:xanthine dehydrogenase molybdenum-binding subunit XdhA [Bacillota bacterium]
MAVGKSVGRVDAYEKVTGRALYTEDMAPQGALVARVVRATIANGRVKGFDLAAALGVPGVVKIVTCFDVPEIDFPTAGHPWSTDTGHQDIADRRLLNRRVRVYGDDIAAIIAEDMVAASRAARLIRVEYEEYPPFTAIEQALDEHVTRLHDFAPGNVLKATEYRFGEGTFEAACEGSVVLTKDYRVQTVQHCHLELPVSFAYMEKGRVVVVSSTQIPHIVRRVVGQALGIPWGKVRVIKPYIGGGFGNKQDVLYEPLNAFLTMRVGGRPVRLELTREETMASTRVRHAMNLTIASAARPDGKLVGRKLVGYSNQGGYASHGHAIISNTASGFRHLYESQVIEARVSTVYTNIAAGGAMRGYGIPQIIFALESHMDDLALRLHMDPLALRRMNAMRPGYRDPGTGITALSSGLMACLDKGERHIRWAEKRKAYANQTGDVRRGVGMAMFSYKTGVHPISLEMASCRMLLNEDGSMQLQVGATEIGQGADTVLTQMAAESTGIPMEQVHIVSVQDTDVSPFDFGAYASRQTYVTGMAVKRTGAIFRQKILSYAAKMLDCPAEKLSLADGRVLDADGNVLLPLEALATEAVYSLKHAATHITAEASYQCEDNTFSFGCCFAEIEVDIPVGKLRVVDIINVHDSGVLINPKLAEAQVHGGMSMGLGYGLSEQLLYSEKGMPLNDNLLDYKLPTAMDTPELTVSFVETVDPTGPFGNKALGEPPAIPVAPAVRNALLHATGVAVDSLPLTPQKLVEHFMDAGLIDP